MQGLAAAVTRDKHMFLRYRSDAARFLLLAAPDRWVTVATTGRP